MNIDLSVTEYFKELQLIDLQYGQEEELYPWVYMLLWMIDREKQKLYGKSYNGISIRDVHKAKSGYENIKCDSARGIKKFMQEQDAFPEFVLFDRNINETKECRCFGCVEIKPLNHKYIKLNDENIYELYKPKYVIRFKNENCQNKYEIEIEECVYKQLKNKTFTVEEHGEHKLEIVIMNDNKKIVLAYKGDKILLNNKKTQKGENLVKKINSQNPPKSPFIEWGEDVWEMMSHIEAYQKVLYTNGLQFCFITRLMGSDDNKNKFKVTEIANLKDAYEQYKEDANYQVEKEAVSEWEKLKYNLSCIDWHSFYKKIPIDVK